LEKQGANLTAEALLRAIAFAANQQGVTSFRNIYVQLDNTGSNKCDTVVVACALLVALGVCKKIKVNFLEVGHTHDDIDALIGSVVVKLRTMDLPTLESRITAIRDALNAVEAQIKAVETVYGITDFENGLERLFPMKKGLVISKSSEYLLMKKELQFFCTNPTLLLMGGFQGPLKERTILKRWQLFSSILNPDTVIQ
jgi:hypothetical protein